MSTWTLSDLPDQTGRTVIVTGASGGLGLIVGRALAGVGANVVLAVRCWRSAMSPKVARSRPGSRGALRCVSSMSPTSRRCGDSLRRGAARSTCW
jgi:NAD(P)-dependent dehydrogenase (short-subunit alcohol dehydrogenase family)